MGDVIEEEEFLFAISFDHKFVLPVGEVDALGEARLRVIGLEPDHHFHLLLSVQAADVRRLHRYI
jgi:hypothetical protein